MSSQARLYTQGNQILFSAKAATGVSPVFECGAFSNVVVAVTGPANSTLTFKFQGSMGKSVSDASAPDFSSAQAVLNQWDYVAVYDIQDPSSVIVGDTGVTIDNVSAAANTRFFRVDTKFLRYLSLEITAWTDGSLTAVVAGAST